MTSSFRGQDYKEFTGLARRERLDGGGGGWQLQSYIGNCLWYKKRKNTHCLCCVHTCTREKYAREEWFASKGQGGTLYPHTVCWSLTSGSSLHSLFCSHSVVARCEFKGQVYHTVTPPFRRMAKWTQCERTIHLSSRMPIFPALIMRRFHKNAQLFRWYTQ